MGKARKCIKNVWKKKIIKIEIYCKIQTQFEINIKKKEGFMEHTKFIKMFKVQIKDFTKCKYQWERNLKEILIIVTSNTSFVDLSEM